MGDRGMLSAREMATVKVAVEICNNPELKKKILYKPDDMRRISCCCDRKRHWEETVERVARGILKTLELPGVLHDQILGTVALVGMRMLTWAEYHERHLGYSREYIIHFLNGSFFTQRGIIDSKRAAEEMMKDLNLSIERKYKLACIHCFTDQIPALFRKLKVEEKERLFSTRQPPLARFWSYLLVGRINEIKGHKTLDRFRLEIAVENRSTAAVQYILEKTNLRRLGDDIVEVAIETVRNMIVSEDDYIVLFHLRYDGGRELFVPSNYYLDILCILLSKMREDQKIQFLKKDIEGARYKIFPLQEHMHSRVLKCLLYWPYQGYFMMTARLMWDFLPEMDYAFILLIMCSKIESEKHNTYLKCGEEKSFDYRGLLKEFWYRSPERYKRYVFTNEEVINGMYRIKVVEAILLKLFNLINFTNEDKKIIDLILASATDKEIMEITSSEQWTYFCIKLLKKEKWGILDRIALICFPHQEEADKFKRELIFTKGALRVCVDFVKNDKWNAIESAVEWSALPEEEVTKMKKEMIYSGSGQKACLNCIQSNEWLESVDRRIRWHLSSEGEVETFKRHLIFSKRGINKCADLVTEDNFDLLIGFINLWLSSEEDIRILKTNVAYERGSFVLEELISGSSEEKKYDDSGFHTGDYYTKFRGGRWEDVEKFLTWCFSSEGEISEFKKNDILKESGAAIHFNLIKCNQWEEALTFFAWLGLSAEEIKELKKETLFDYYEARAMFRELMHSEEGDKRFVDYGCKQEAVELLLRWYLIDEETILEFKDEFKGQYYGQVTEERQAMFDNFDRAISQRLMDLEKDKISIKRKSETFSPSKRVCNV